jgi:hypothetical protein
MIPNKYNKTKLIEALHNPEKLTRQIYNITYKIFNRLRYGKKVDIMCKDWDNLIILDACRHDIFSTVNDIDGKLRKVVSSGSSSREFMRENFKGRILNDTVYITGNPQCHRVGIENTFHDIIYSYNSDSFQSNRWNEMTLENEASPERVYKSALKGLREYQNKRKIIHFMQPHDPYHGHEAKKIRKRLNNDHQITFNYFVPHNKIENMNSDKVYASLLYTLNDGYITPEELREVYIENLEIVLQYVDDLLDNLEGRTIITADHGELLGNYHESKLKRFSYSTLLGEDQEITTGHLGNSPIPELRLVPWLVIDSDERPEISSEKQVNKEEISQEVIDNQLKALGYR